VIKYFTVAFLLIALSAVGQKKKKEEAQLLTDKSEWFEGSVLLTDGNELKGLVKYNSRNGVLSYQDGTDSRVFTANRVVAFEFYDESVQKQRVFYTFDYQDAETNVVRPLFFEVLKQYKSFAVLSKQDRIDVNQKSIATPSDFNPVTGAYQPNGFNNSSERLVISQAETIYVMNDNGEIKPYFKEVNTDDGQKSFLGTGSDTKTTNKTIDRDLLGEFLSPVIYEKLKRFAAENQLGFNKKKDILKILEHYDTLLED
jgi:hypothetical protein